MEKRKYLIAVLHARLNKKGQLSLMTRWRMYRAAKKGANKRQEGSEFRYVLVPHPSAAAKEQTRRLLMELATRDRAYEGSYLTPELGTTVPARLQIDFVREAAVNAGAKFLVA